jgi:hypothetical protein
MVPALPFTISGKSSGKRPNAAETLFSAIESIFNISKRYLALFNDNLKGVTPSHAAGKLKT